MSAGKYYYQIEFTDGRIIRRVGVPRKIASSIAEAMTYEMLLFGVESVSWGIVQE
jgi:hypothetical protein